MKISLFFFLFVFSVPVALQAATIDDLLITEVVPSTGQIEITNTGTDALTIEVRLPFCHRFRYSDTIPAGTVFEAGESKVFIASFSNEADSDLWLYRGGSFGSATNIISGLKWGPAKNVGRTGIATTAGLWDGLGSAAPPSGMALQLANADATASTSWSIGAPDLGNFDIGGNETPPLDLDLTLEGNELVFNWVGGTPPFRFQASTDLIQWESATGLLDSRTHRIALNPEIDALFFRLADQAELENSAEFRITFETLWTDERFSSVPGNSHFSGLVGATHNDSVSFWSPGINATPGIRSMAETGSKTALLQEITAAINGGTADMSLSGGGLAAAPAQTTLNFTANRAHPLLSLTSMIAPSPDWFVGLHGQSLLQANDDWIQSLTIDLVAYDAGTDSGANFTSANQATSPAVHISLIPANDPIFVPASDPVGDPIPIARLTIERVN